MHILACLLLLFPVSGVSAHGDQPSFESEASGYLLDIGYDRTGFRPHEPVTFDFDLFTTDETPSFVHFDSVDVRIARAGELFLSQHVENDPTFVPTLEITFPAEGSYVLTASFLSGASVLASDSYAIEVKETAGQTDRMLELLLYVIAAALVVACIGTAVRSYLRR